MCGQLMMSSIIPLATNRVQLDRIRDPVTSVDITDQLPLLNARSQLRPRDVCEIDTW